MLVADANTILRFLLNDNSLQFEQAANVFDSSTDVFIPSEIIAEVVYVMQKVYQIPRTEICSSLLDFIQYKNIFIDDKSIIFQALNYYADSKLDYADCIVLSTAKRKKAGIFSFDKGLLSFFKKSKE